jgi:tRNA(fMet)-specific endonuclease VapC
MILLDTDTFTLHQLGHERVTLRMKAATEIPAITIVTQIEVLRGRYDALLKAEDGARVLRAQRGIAASVQHLALFEIVTFDDAAGTEFDRLLATKGLRRLGRGDLLIASITLANRATLVTRNRKDFQKVPGLQFENWAD